jgi:hypothetical protein
MKLAGQQQVGNKFKTIKQITVRLTPRSEVLLQTLTVHQIVKEFPVFYVALQFTTVFTTSWT